MTWWLLGLLAWLAFGLETGLKDTLRLGGTQAAPSFVIPLAVFVAMFAPPVHAVWVCLSLGLMMDLTAPAPTEAGRLLTVIGPYTLGFFVAGEFVVAVRGLMIRRNPLTMVFLSVVGAMLAHLVVTAMFSTRSLYDGLITWQGVEQLVGRAGSSLYTGVSALVLSLVLLPLAPLMGFPQGHTRAIPRRSYERR